MGTFCVGKKYGASGSFPNIRVCVCVCVREREREKEREKREREKERERERQTDNARSVSRVQQGPEGEPGHVCDCIFKWREGDVPRIQVRSSAPNKTDK
jgi:hypothetical protein